MLSPLEPIAGEARHPRRQRRHRADRSRARARDVSAGDVGTQLPTCEQFMGELKQQGRAAAKLPSGDAQLVAVHRRQVHRSGEHMTATSRPLVAHDRRRPHAVRPVPARLQAARRPARHVLRAPARRRRDGAHDLRPLEWLLRSIRSRRSRSITSIRARASCRSAPPAATSRASSARTGTSRSRARWTASPIERLARGASRARRKRAGAASVAFTYNDPDDLRRVRDGHRRCLPRARHPHRRGHRRLHPRRAAPRVLRRRSTPRTSTSRRSPRTSISQTAPRTSSR